MNQRFITERVIIDLSDLVNSFNDVSFTLVVYGKSSLWDAGDFSAVVP